MAAQETKLFNAYESTLTATAGASDLTFTVNSVTAPTSVTLAVPFYLVINPDSSTNREVVEITSINTGTKTLTCSAIGKRYLAGSAAASGLSHASGSTVRMSPVQQHIEDLNDRVDTIINEAGTAVNTSLFLDEDDMSTDSATKGVTQQSVKAYVDSQVTAQDLDFSGDSDTGSPSVDLDSQTFEIAGGEGIDTSGSGQTLTIAGEDATTSNKGIASFSSDNFSVSSGAVTIKAGGVDLTAEVTGTLPVANGGTGATTLTDGGVLLGSGTSAVTATAVLTNGQLLIGDGTGDPTVGTLTEGSNVTITNGAGSITIASTDTTYSAGDLIDFDGTQIDVDLSEASEAAIADGDYVMFLDGGATGTAAKEAIGDIATLFSGDGLQASSSVMSLDLKSNGGIVIESNEAAIDLGASSITGTLDETDGGTGLTSYTAGDVIYASGSNTLAKLAKGSAGEVLTMNSGATAPEWSSDSDTTYSAGDGLDLSGTTFSTDLKANGGLVIESTEVAVDLGASSITGTLDETDGGTGLTSYAAGDILYASGSNTLAKLTKGSGGEALKMNSGGTAPEWGSVGSATALIDGDSDFTLADGVANGIHYELDDTDMANWNNAGIALTTAGGIFQHNQTQAATYTVASGVGAVLAGPITITGTVTNAGTMVVL